MLDDAPYLLLITRTGGTEKPDRTSLLQTFIHCRARMKAVSISKETFEKQFSECIY